MTPSFLVSVCSLAASLAFLPARGQASAPLSESLPPVDQVIARHIEARGGLAKIKAIHSLTSVGQVLVGPVALDLRIDNTRQAFRADTSIQGLTKTEAFDGVEGWIIDPFTGRGPVTEPEPMNPDQLKQVALQMDFDGPLVDATAKGHRVSVVGMEPVEGAAAYVLKISLNNGDELKSYIDLKTWMEVKTVNKAVSQGKVVDLETILGDYRAVNGVLLPFSLDIRPVGQAQGLKIRFDRVEANLPMDATRFKRPTMTPKSGMNGGGRRVPNGE